MSNLDALQAMKDENAASLSIVKRLQGLSGASQVAVLERTLAIVKRTVDEKKPVQVDLELKG